MSISGFLPRSEFPQLIAALRKAGYQVLGPRFRDGAIVYEPLEHADSLPRGQRDEQAPGQYRLVPAAGPRWFAWANGPQALKPLLFAPSEIVWRARRTADGQIVYAEEDHASPARAVLGVRACDLAALALQDRHFLHGAVPDPGYAARRKGLFLITVHCTHPAATCFCASTGDGPRAERGYDLALSELDDGFLVDSGSVGGERIARGLPLQAATAAQRETAENEIAGAARQQRRLPARNLRDALYARLEHPHWREVAQRCVSCGNCTSVCPTCFCHGEHDDTDLDGSASRHVREWDSCFTQKHSYIHGMTIRAGTRERYRQWLTHKLAGWHDQYGRSGCVGCGRCISWCPTGIDLTDEVAHLLIGGDHE